MTTATPELLALGAVYDEFRRQAQHTGKDAHRYDWRNEGGCQDAQCRYHARPKQLASAEPWLVWLILSGRGWGKTRTGAEFVREKVERGEARRIAFIAETKADARDVMVEDPTSGILAVSPPWNRPLWEPSKRRLTWPNGAAATVYSGDEPDQLRGPQHDLAWCDELAKYKYPQDAWDNLMFGLRIGADPRVIVTTTPRPIPIIKQMVAAETTHVTPGHTYENLDNLAPTFRQRVIERYEGTRLGRQELAGEILEDIEGALWMRVWIESTRVMQAPVLTRVVVAIDPSGSDDEGASEQGIVVAGLGWCTCRGAAEQHSFVLYDASGHRTPNEWARVAIGCYSEFQADRIVAEQNFGGAMVEATLRSAWPDVPYKALTASRGKQVRAEPVAALYEQGKVHHVGTLPDLEDQLCTWVPGEGRSPDRLDALVWALTELMLIEEEIVVELGHDYRPSLSGRWDRW